MDDYTSRWSASTRRLREPTYVQTYRSLRGGPSTADDGSVASTVKSDGTARSMATGFPSLASAFSNLLPASIISFFEPAPPACEVDDQYWLGKLTPDRVDRVFARHPTNADEPIKRLWSRVVDSLTPCGSTLDYRLDVSWIYGIDWPGVPI